MFERERELDSGRSRSAKVRRSSGFSRPIPFPFPHERLLPRLCNEMQFRYALKTVVALFPAIFAKFKMPEGLESFSRYPAQFRYLLTWSVRLQRSNAARALFLASTNSFFKVLLQVVFRSARLTFFL